MVYRLEEGECYISIEDYEVHEMYYDFIYSFLEERNYNGN